MYEASRKVAVSSSASKSAAWPPSPRALAAVTLPYVCFFQEMMAKIPADKRPLDIERHLESAAKLEAMLRDLIGG